MGERGVALRPAAPAPMILLDTNALLWLHRGHPRARRLARSLGRLYVSPASVLELQLLIEVGRLRLKARASVEDLVNDDRWAIDDPPAAAWFERALATILERSAATCFEL